MHIRHRHHQMDQMAAHCLKGLLQSLNLNQQTSTRVFVTSELPETVDNLQQLLPEVVFSRFDPTTIPSEAQLKIPRELSKKQNPVPGWFGPLPRWSALVEAQILVETSQVIMVTKKSGLSSLLTGMAKLRGKPVIFMGKECELFPNDMAKKERIDAFNLYFGLKYQEWAEQNNCSVIS